MKLSFLFLVFCPKLILQLDNFGLLTELEGESTLLKSVLG